MSAFLFASFAFAQTMDQPSPSVGNGDYVDFIDPNESIYQSFTAGISGTLDRLDIAVEHFGSSETITVEIYSGSIEDADLSGSPLGSTTYVVPLGNGVSPIIGSVNFTGVDIILGLKYSIKFSGVTNSSNFFYRGETASSYSAGVYTPKSGQPDLTADVYFVTYVTEDTSVPFESLCGTTVNGSEVASVTEATGASTYYFDFSNGGSIHTQEVRSTNKLDLSTIDDPSLVAGVTYDVVVKANDTTPRSTVLTGCQITLEGPATTALTSGDCGATFTSWSDTLHADAASGATQYYFRITGTGVDVEKLRSTPELKLSDVQFLLAKGTSYNVQVQGVTSGVRGAYGSVCTITTPGAAQGSISNCGTVFTAWSQTIDATAQTGADLYQFRFDDGGAPVIVYSATSSMRMFKAVTPLDASTVYTVRTAARKGGVWGTLSAAGCSVTTPGFDLARDAAFTASGENVFMYPNPAVSEFVYFSSELHNVTVYDALGNLITESAAAEYLNVSSMEAGIYFVKSDEGVSRLVVD